MTQDQELYAQLAEVAHTTYAGGYDDDDIRSECDRINTRFGIKDAYQRSEAIYRQQYESGFSTVLYLLLACLPAGLVFFGLLPLFSLIPTV